MPISFITSINSLNPKAQSPQSLIPPTKLLGAVETLPLARLSLLLISLLGALGLEMKNALITHDKTVAASRLLKIEGLKSPMVLNADEFNNTPSFLPSIKKQSSQSFDLQKQNKPRFGIAPGGSAPEAKVNS